jgi:hypothetical protein
VAHFVCDFEDGYRLTVKEGMSHPASSTVSMSVTTPRGLIVTANSDALVTMRYVSTSKVSVPKQAREEFSRSVGPGGVVTRWMRDGSVHIYRSDGSTMVKPFNAPNYILTNMNGTRARVIPPMKRPNSRSSRRSQAVPNVVTEPLVDLTCSIEYDPESGARVTMVHAEETSATLVLYQDGSKLARFQDGTSIRTVSS